MAFGCLEAAADTDWPLECDLDAYLAYLDSVAAHHEHVKQHFLPVIFSEATVAEVDWAAAPRHQHRDWRGR